MLNQISMKISPWEGGFRLCFYDNLSFSALEKREALKSFTDVQVMQSFQERLWISGSDTDHLIQLR